MSQAAETPFPVVGIGASAPADPGLAMVVIQHLDPRHESHLPELLQPRTARVVTEAFTGESIRQDHLYVSQPNTD